MALPSTFAHCTVCHDSWIVLLPEPTAENCTRRADIMGDRGYEAICDDADLIYQCPRGHRETTVLHPGTIRLGEVMLWERVTRTDAVETTSPEDPAG